MREIKFRAWDERNKEMRYSDKHDGEFYINTKGAVYSYTIPKTNKNYHNYDLMQYIGLKDKNGKEIYEGDIIKWYNDLAKIEWQEELAQFNAYRFVEPIPLYRQKIDSHNWMDAEVIGNVYENEDLLK